MADLTAKEKLLEAAIAVINEKGEAGVRVDDLLAEVGVTAPTLYHHFGNREGLIVEAQAERFHRVANPNYQQLTQALSLVTTEKEFREVIDSISTMLAGAPFEMRFQRINAIGASYARPELAKRITEMNDQLVVFVANALRPFQEKGWIRQDIDLELVVAWYNGATLGRMLVEMAPTQLPSEKWIDVMMETVRYLLFGQPV